MAKATTGKQLISAAWSALKQDKELMILPILGGIFAAIAVAVISTAGWIAGAFTSLQTDGAAVTTTQKAVSFTFAFLVAYASTFIALFFQSAVISGAMQRLDGGNPTVSSSLAAARKKIGPIMVWAFIATTVGLILRALSERGGAFAKIGSVIAGIAWSVATFFVLPIVLFEGVNSFAAVKRSAQLISQRWGTVARTNIRFGLKLFVAIVVSFGALIGGIVMAITSADRGTGVSPAVGIAISVLGFVLLIITNIVTSSLSGYIRAVLYRHAVGQPVPGVDQAIMAGAFPLKN